VTAPKIMIVAASRTANAFPDINSSRCVHAVWFTQIM
jgi:hypothetical protein